MLEDDKAQLEMDLIMNEQEDPVSGNIAPIGAKPSEVRDDIDIRVSENEYVVNAQTVRYFGEEFFNELQEAAKQGFQRIKEGEELPFRDNELEVEEDEIEEVEPKGFAGGGPVGSDKEVPKPVGGGYGGYGGTGNLFTGFQSKTFINPETNQKIVIFYFNGRPMSRIPSGFREMGVSPAEEQAQATRQETDEDPTPRPDQESDPTWRNTPVEEWTNDMYKSYSDYHQLKENAGDLSTLEKALFGLVGGVVGGPVGSVALSELARRQNKKIANQVVTSVMDMVDKNKNPDGSPLDVDTLNILNRARVNANYNIMNLENKNILGFDKNKGILDFDKEGSGSISAGSEEAQEILKQQRAIVEKAKELDPERKSDIFRPGAFLGTDTKKPKVTGPPSIDPTVPEGYVKAPLSGEYVKIKDRDDDDDDDPFFAGAFYGGSEEAETDLITSDLSDEEFFEQWEDDVTAGTNVGNVGNSGSDKDDDDKDKGGCVIATHGISTGGFSAMDKAKAELWCERTYHNKWYGEAFRRGYRYAGRKAIERGEAEKHYQEFKDFVSYGRGLKKDLKSALNYYKRTTQFFLTGLFVKD